MKPNTVRSQASTTSKSSTMEHSKKQKILGRNFRAQRRQPLLLPGFGFESRAHLAAGAEIRIQIVSTGNWTGEVAIYPEAHGYMVAPVDAPDVAQRTISAMTAALRIRQCPHLNSPKLL
jgi:hypothetical protein